MHKASPLRFIKSRWSTVAKRGNMERPWFKYWPKGVPTSLDYPHGSLDSLLKRAGKEWPESTATLFYGQKLTYSEIDRLASNFAANLQSIGVRKGDRVSLLMPNCPQFVVAFFGILRAGGIVVQTDPLYTARELETLYGDARVENVAVLDILLEGVLKAKQETPVKRVVVTDMKHWLPPLTGAFYGWKKRSIEKKRGNPSASSGEWRHDFDVMTRPGGKRPKPVRCEDDDVAVLQYTGGTTGTPKGAMLTHRNMIANAFQTAAWLPDAKLGGEKFLSVIPFSHAYGLTTSMLAPTVLGAVMILHPDPREIDKILALADATRPTIFPGVPAMFAAIVNNPATKKRDLTSIRICISGSAPLPSTVRNKFEDITGSRLVEGYGLSEASPVTHCNPFFGLVKDCIGIPFPDTDAKIVDPATGLTDMAVGEAGELAVSGPQVMRGYWNKHEETALVMCGPWLLTGDIARMDEDGYFHVIDRKKDMINCAGYKVYPREVEEVLGTHEAVKECAALGVPVEMRGESVKVFVVLRKDMKATAEEIKMFCRERLAAFKIPSHVEFVRELPKNAMGKVLRRSLRES